jgi:hypothetical protein
MESGSFVPRTSTDRNLTQRDTTSIGLSTSPAGESPRLDRNTNTNGDLRSALARRFMGMLRSHDRARLELLETQPPLAK